VTAEPVTDADPTTPPQWNTAGDVADDLRDLVAAAFTATSATNPHDPERLSLSGLGGCTRRAAYSVAGTPASDVPPPEQARQANLGTWEHDGLLPQIAQLLPGALVEHPVELHAAGLRIPGRLDLWWPGLLLDLKTVGEHRLSGVRRAGAPYPEHVVQTRGYALALHQAGMDVRWVASLYMDRADGGEEPMVERFDAPAALSVISRAEEIVEAAAEPDEARRDGRGPGLGFTCDSCPWLRRCWGDDAQPGVVGAQRNLARTDPQVEAALAMYVEARDREAAAKRDKEFAAAIIDGKRWGTYGPYELRRGRPHDVLDHETVRSDYATRGEAVPMMETSPPLIVKVLKVLTDAANEAAGGAG
jgi:hypothetical protein